MTKRKQTKKREIQPLEFSGDLVEQDRQRQAKYEQEQKEPPGGDRTEPFEDYCQSCEIAVVVCGTCGTQTCTGVISCPDCAKAYDLDAKLHGGVVACDRAVLAARD